ncbi:MAG: hypothetical protein M5U08_12265 [Burkholderiales bacterium]|nr:hypothetical protein [Burkholderiales bacterium]
MRTLAEFAEFIAARAQRRIDAEIVTLRPQRESVVQAVKRLNRSYPMLSRTRLMGPVGDLVSAHMVDGRDAKDVIDDLEALYAAAFSAFRQGA